MARIAETPRVMVTNSGDLRQSQENPRSGISWQWIDGCLLVLAVAAYLVAQLSLLKPPALEGGDQLDYFTTAANLPDVSPTHRHLRLGLLLPVRLAIEAFDYSEAAYYVVPVLSGVLLCASTFMLAWILFDRLVAFPAALLVVLNPYVLWESSHLLPDMPGAALFTAAILAVTAGVWRYHAAENASIWAGLLVALGGFLLAWSYMNREFLVIMFPLALLPFYIFRVPWRKAAWIVPGALPPLMVELIWGWMVYRDPLIRIATAGGTRTVRSPGPPSFATEAGDVLLLLGSNLLRFSVGGFFIGLFILGVVFGTVAMARGDKRFWLPLLWTAGTWVLLTFVGLVPVFLTEGNSLYLRLQKFRYWLPILPGLLILGCATIDMGRNWLAKQSRWAGRMGILVVLGVPAIIAFLGIDSIAGSGTYVRNGATKYVEIRNYLHVQGSNHNLIYTDTEGGQAFGLVLPMYAQSPFGTATWDGEIRSLGHNTEFIPLEDIESGLVIARPIGYRWLISRRDGFVPPEYLLTPPSNWKTTMITSNGEVVVYLVDAHEQIQVGMTDFLDWRRTDGKDSLVSDVPGTVIFEADGGETMSIIDADGLTHGSGGIGLQVGDSESYTLWGRLEAKIEGSGRLTIYCHFIEDGQPVASVDATSRDRYDVGVESIDYRCRAPGGTDHDEVDVNLEVAGPLHLTLGTNRAYLDPDD